MPYFCHPQIGPGESVAALVLDITASFVKIPLKRSQRQFAVANLTKASGDVYNVLPERRVERRGWP
eukprot:593980-Amphidinium_carterae.1